MSGSDSVLFCLLANRVKYHGQEMYSVDALRRPRMRRIQMQIWGECEGAQKENSIGNRYTLQTVLLQRRYNY